MNIMNEDSPKTREKREREREERGQRTEERGERREERERERGGRERERGGMSFHVCVDSWTFKLMYGPEEKDQNERHQIPNASTWKSIDHRKR